MNMHTQQSPFQPGVAPDWFPYWGGETCIIVASGPTAAKQNLAQYKGKVRFIVINTSWRLAPWAEVLYACDSGWWLVNDGAPEFHGLKLTVDRQSSVHPSWGIQRVHCDKTSDRMVFDKFGTIGWGGNSGFGALNLAIQFGAKKIVLVGYDMTVEHGRHWHDDHPAGMHNPLPRSAERWRRAIDRAADAIAETGVRVINCSPVSALKKFPIMPLEEAIGGLA